MDYNDQNMMNLLISKIFHDIGNIASLLNFVVELNRDNPEKLDFNELIDINNRTLVSINVLKYAFLPSEYEEKALEDIKEYFAWRKITVAFDSSNFCFSQENLKIIVHVLMLLTKITYMGADTVIKYNGAALTMECNSKEAIEKNRLTVFDNLDSKGNVHIHYLKNTLEKSRLGLFYNLVTEDKVVLEFK